MTQKIAVLIVTCWITGSIFCKDRHFYNAYTGLFKMIFGVLTTCHTQYNSDSSICIFLFNITTLPVFVTYLTGVLYVHLLWFYKHLHDNQVLQMQPHVISFYGVTSRIRFMFLRFPHVTRNSKYESELPLKPSPLTCYRQVGTNSIIGLMFLESQRVHI